MGAVAVVVRCVRARFVLPFIDLAAVQAGKHAALQIGVGCIHAGVNDRHNDFIIFCIAKAGQLLLHGVQPHGCHAPGEILPVGGVGKGGHRKVCILCNGNHRIHVQLVDGFIGGKRFIGGHGVRCGGILEHVFAVVIHHRFGAVGVRKAVGVPDDQPVRLVVVLFGFLLDEITGVGGQEGGDRLGIGQGRVAFLHLHVFPEINNHVFFINSGILPDRRGQHRTFTDASRRQCCCQHACQTFVKPYVFFHAILFLIPVRSSSRCKAFPFQCPPIPACRPAGGSAGW